MQPFSALAAIAQFPDEALAQRVSVAELRATKHFILYDLLRREQSLASSARRSERSELARILDLVQMAYADVVALLVGRPDDLLDGLRDGDWTLRDLLRHAIAVELRYAAQVHWAATRRDDEPLAIPDERLPCDRLSPPDPEFGESRTGGVARLLELVGLARRRTDVLLEPLPDAVLDRPSLWTHFQMPVRMRLHQSAAHLTEVAVHLEKMLRATVPDGEARRTLRRCCAMRGLHERWSNATERAELDARYRALASS